MNSQRDKAFIKQCKKQDKRNDKTIRQWLNKEDTKEARRIERFFMEGRKMLDKYPRPLPGGYKSIFDMQ